MAKNSTPKQEIDVESDAQETRVMTQEELKRATELANRMLQITKAKILLEERLAKLNDEYERIAGADLPGLMAEIGLKDFSLTTGQKILIKDIVALNLPTESAINKEKDPDKRAELKHRFEMGIKYLEKNGAAALISRSVVATLGKDATKLAKDALAALKNLGIDTVSAVRSVHPQSLNSWGKERIAGGKMPPEEIFKVYTGTRADVVLPKKSKTA